MAVAEDPAVAPAAAPATMAEIAGTPDAWVPTFEPEGADGSPFDASGKFVAPAPSIEDTSPFDDPAGPRPNVPNFGPDAFADPAGEMTAETKAEAADATPTGDDPEPGDAAAAGEPVGAKIANASDASAPADGDTPDEQHEPEPGTDTVPPSTPDPDHLAQALTQAARTEAHIHAAGRSYWWTAGDAFSPPAVVAFAGLPDGAAFAAMLGGLRSAALANSAE